MPGAADKEFAIARVYATAMLQLAESKKESEQLLNELSGIVEYLDKNAEFDGFLTSPMVDAESRRRTIEKLFRGKLSDLCVDALQVMNRKDRLGLIRAVSEAYRLAHEELRGVVEVHVRSAVALPREVKEQLVRFGTRVTGRKAAVVDRVDESLLGGLIVQIGDRKYDMSVATHLKEIGRLLLDRASRDIHRGALYVE